jgi:hypothetical protein
MGDTIVKVTLPTDSRGFLGRLCPSADCRQYFKLKPGTGLPTSGCRCPYCGASGDTQAFSTADQIEYAKSIALRQFAEPLLRQFGQNMQGTRGGLIEIKFSMHTPEFRIHHYRDADVETDATCDHCGLEFAVYGVFALCPDCGKLNAFSVFRKSIEACGRRLKLLDLEDTKGDDELARSILRDALTSSVSAFDALGKKLREVAPQVFPAKPRNLFQNFYALDAALRANGQGITDRLGSQQRSSRLLLLLQVRHIVAHNSCVIDDDFIKNVPSYASSRGRLYRLSRAELEETLGLLGDLTNTLQRDFAVLVSQRPS